MAWVDRRGDPWDNSAILPRPASSLLTLLGRRVNLGGLIVAGYKGWETVMTLKSASVVTIASKRINPKRRNMPRMIRVLGEAG